MTAIRDRLVIVYQVVLFACSIFGFCIEIDIGITLTFGDYSTIKSAQ